MRTIERNLSAGRNSSKKNLQAVDFTSPLSKSETAENNEDDQDHMVSYLIHSENYVIHSINNLYFRNIVIGGAKESLDHFHPHSECLLYTPPYTV